MRYEEPRVDIIVIKEEDIVTTSSGLNNIVTGSGTGDEGFGFDEFN